MHDPMTQAFQIKLPIWRTSMLGGKPWRYFRDFITIWHVDPERGGSDDSCGWSRPRPTEKQREIIKWLAHDEVRNPWFMSLSAKTNSNPVECEIYVRGAILLVASCMENRGCLRCKVTLEQATVWASLLVHNSADNIRSSLAWLSGWHGNTYHDNRPNTAEEDIWFREESAKGFFGCIMGYILREQRPWWKHPKFHIMHWKRRVDHAKSTYQAGGEYVKVYKYRGIPLPVVGWQIQVHQLQTFKRWAFSKCCKCGKGFGWGYSPSTGNWNSTGPLWFRSEQGVYHASCDCPSDTCGPYEAKQEATTQ